MNNNKTLYDTVIKNDYCIGCGVCSYVAPEFEVKMDKYGMFKADVTQLSAGTSEIANKICPFSDSSKNEDHFSESLFTDAAFQNNFIGKYISNYVGHVKEGEYREKGSSGGLGKWILNELLVTNKVDYVLQIVSQEVKDELFTYQIYKKGDDILSGSKSAYYPVTLKDSLDFIKNNDGKYVITALPCFSKAIRNLCLYDEVLNSRIAFIVGIVCGHLKSTAYAESLGWQLDVVPKSLRGIEFRGKIPGLKANDKGVYATDNKGNLSAVKSSKKLFGGNWGYGFFKYKACDYCDDVVGETCDISIGDAWLDEYIDDHEGNNVIIIRNKDIASLIQTGIDEDRISLNLVEDKVVVKSQLGGIRHRREGLSYRLFNKKKNNEWVPKKRVEPDGKINPNRKRIYKVREEMRDASHQNFLKAKEHNDWEEFNKPMRRYLLKLGDRPFLIKVIHKIQEILFDISSKKN